MGGVIIVMQSNITLNLVSDEIYYLCMHPPFIIIALILDLIVSIIMHGYINVSHYSWHCLA